MAWQHQSLYAVHQFRNVEIDKQSEGAVGQFHVRERLRAVNRQQRRHAFRFYNDRALRQVTTRLAETAATQVALPAN